MPAGKSRGDDPAGDGVGAAWAGVCSGGREFSFGEGRGRGADLRGVAATRHHHPAGATLRPARVVAHHGGHPGAE